MAGRLSVSVVLRPLPFSVLVNGRSGHQAAQSVLTTKFALQHQLCNYPKWTLHEQDRS